MSVTSTMKKIRTFLLSVLLLLVFSWVFLVTFIAKAPAEWLLVQAQNNGLIKQVAWQNVQGNLSNGSIQRLDLPFISLEDVSWNLSIWRLFLANPAINLQVGSEELAWHLHTSLLPWGGLTANLQAGDLTLLKGRGLPWAMQGELAGRVSLTTNLAKKEINCQNLSGNLTGRLKVLQPMPLDLGQISLQPNCPDSQTLDWKLTAEQTGEHQINLEGQANAKTHRWSFTAQAKLEEASKLRPSLQLLGWRRDNQGDLQAKGSGRF